MGDVNMFIRFSAFFCMAFFLIVLCYAESEEQPCVRWIWEVKIDPNQSETIYSNVYDMTINKNVIYKSLDAGANWHNISSVNLALHDLLIDPKDSRKIYASINDAHNYGGNKSTDGGITWNYVTTTPNIINPHNSEIMYSIGGGGIRKSTNGGVSWADLKGDWKSCSAVALAFQNPQILYTYCQGGSSPGIFKSTNAGIDWEIVLPIPGIWKLAIDPKNPEIVYAGTRYQGVYRSVDGGKNWKTVKDGLPRGYGPFLSGAVPWTMTKDEEPVNEPIVCMVIDPMHSNILYVGTSAGVFKSIDSGANWRGINKGLPASSVLTLALNPKDPNIIYTGTEFSGVFKSIDGGETWTPASNGIACGPKVLVW